MKTEMNITEVYNAIENDEITFDNETQQCDQCGECFDPSELIKDRDLFFCQTCKDKNDNTFDSQDTYDSLSDEEQRDWDRRASGGWQ